MTDMMPVQRESARDLVRRLWDEDRYVIDALFGYVARRQNAVALRHFPSTCRDIARRAMAPTASYWLRQPVGQP
jgi:hypothetical protein